jgi:anti-sigma factor RsiW
MTGCDMHRKRLSAHHDGELPANERAEVDTHLAACAPCRTLLAQLAEADRAWTSVPEPAWRADSTDALVGKLKAELAKEAPATPPAHVIAAAAGWGPWRSLAFGVAGILALAVFPAAFSLTKSESRSSDASQLARAAGAPAPSPMAQTAPMAPAPAVAPVGKDADRGAARLAEAAPAREVQVAKAKDSKPVEVAKLEVPPAQRAEPAAQEAQEGGARSNRAATASPESFAAARPVPPAEPAIANAITGKVAAPAGPDPLRADLAAVEARIQAVEAEVAQFTIAAREQAVQSSQLVSTRRYVPWR